MRNYVWDFEAEGYLSSPVFKATERLRHELGDRVARELALWVIPGYRGWVRR